MDTKLYKFTLKEIIFWFISPFSAVRVITQRTKRRNIERGTGGLVIVGLSVISYGPMHLIRCYEGLW